MGQIGSKEAAERLGCTQQHVTHLIRSGELKGNQVGRTWVIDERSVDALLRREAATADQPKRGRPRGSTSSD